VQPVGAVQHICEWCDVYGAVAPTTGGRFFLGLPSLNAEAFPLFIDAFAQAFLDRIEYLPLNEQTCKIENLETRMKKLEDAPAV
jgi:hypothetical protein